MHVSQTPPVPGLIITQVREFLLYPSYPMRRAAAFIPSVGADLQRLWRIRARRFKRVCTADARGCAVVYARARLRKSRHSEISTLHPTTSQRWCMRARYCAQLCTVRIALHLRIPQPKTRAKTCIPCCGTDHHIQCRRTSRCWRSSASGLPRCCWGSAPSAGRERAVYFFERCLAPPDAARPFLAMGV